MSFLKKIKEFKKIKFILGWHQGGIYKRIDENRELLILLQEEAPELLKQKPWIYQWIESNDDFLVNLSQATVIPSCRFEPKEPTKVSNFSFPRSFPKQVIRKN